MPQARRAFLPLQDTTDVAIKPSGAQSNRPASRPSSIEDAAMLSTSATERVAKRRFPIGAEPTEHGVHFRVWAPRRSRAVVVFEGPDAVDELPLTRDDHGYFSGISPTAKAGALYRFRLDDATTLYPDPASRFQPTGPHGPSQVVDPQAYRWSDAAWPGVVAERHVIYEMHIGTFTQAGTWAAAAEQLPRLAELGITLLEVMPVSDFAGNFGWGYDGVDLFAPTRLYGTPDDFRSFVDRAHALRLAVVLDVVYNHFGPDGCYHREFSTDYFTDKYQNDWGESVNFDGKNAAGVREFVVTNAAYWIAEYHLDGLRLDATQNVYDASPEHVLAELTRAARQAAGKRSIFVVAENEPQEARYVRPAEQGGYGVDALWNDDFHHTAKVALTGHSEAYYTDYLGTPQEFISALKRGYLYQGQWYRWQKKRRGTSSLDVDRRHFVSFLENHDQLANSGDGSRSHQMSDPHRYRALTGLLLLGTANPMLFQGEEFSASSPFFYFADHRPELAPIVAEGRRNFLAQFPSLASPTMQERIPDPVLPTTFARSKLDWNEWDEHVEAVALHRDLLRLRHNDRVLADATSKIDGAVLGPQAFVLRFFDSTGSDDRILLVNLGSDLRLSPIPEPLVAEPADRAWHVAWYSEDPQYGGLGMQTPTFDADWVLPGNCAVYLVPVAVQS
jgi:maltooligosyltrehalose trehalohydrolase